MTKLAIFNEFPSIPEQQAAWKNTHSGSAVERYATACEVNHGTKMFGLVRAGKIGEAAVDCFLQLLGWDADKQVDVAHQYRMLGGLPRLPREAGVPVPVAAARVRVYAKLYALALEHLENAQWVAPEAAPAMIEAGEEEEEFIATQGLDLRHTVHTYDMYKMSLQKVCEQMNENELDAQITAYAESLRVPSLAARLLSTLKRTNLKVGRGGQGSSTRMVLLCSPPFGYGLCEHDKLPASDAEWQVHAH